LVTSFIFYAATPVLSCGWEKNHTSSPTGMYYRPRPSCRYPFFSYLARMGLLFFVPQLNPLPIFRCAPFRVRFPDRPTVSRRAPALCGILLLSLAQSSCSVRHPAHPSIYPVPGCIRPIAEGDGERRAARQTAQGNSTGSEIGNMGTEQELRASVWNSRSAPALCGILLPSLAQRSCSVRHPITVSRRAPALCGILLIQVSIRSRVASVL